MLIAMFRVLKTRGTSVLAKSGFRTRSLMMGIMGASLIFGGVVHLMPSHALAADESEAKDSVSHAVGDGPPDERYYTPFFDKTSGSYFQLVPSDRRMSWDKARDDAALHSYKGRQGRLAVIKSYATHINILRNTSVDIRTDTWIGLEYLCGPKQLAWVDGSLYKPGEYTNWYLHWTLNDFACQGDFMGVTISPKVGMRWLAYGYAKGFDWYIVEYPAPSKDKAAQSDSSGVAEVDASK